jgi:hypothetical protein
MFADSEKEKDEWIGVIGRAIVQASSTLIKEGGTRTQSDIISFFDRSIHLLILQY